MVQIRLSRSFVVVTSPRAPRSDHGRGFPDRGIGFGYDEILMEFVVASSEILFS